MIQHCRCRAGRHAADLSSDNCIDKTPRKSSFFCPSPRAISTRNRSKTELTRALDAFGKFTMILSRSTSGEESLEPSQVAYRSFRMQAIANQLLLFPEAKPDEPAACSARCPSAFTCLPRLSSPLDSPRVKHGVQSSSRQRQV